jgi:molecular chaperone IbpA
MSRIDSKSLSALIDQALNGNLLNLADTLHRFNALPLDTVSSHKYPPSNIAMLDENSWLIELAVAGFSLADLNVSLQKNNVLEVTGEIPSTEQDQRVKYIRRGIGLRNFTERYELAENARVTDVKLINGLLSITVKRDPPSLPEPKILKITQG